MIRLVLVALAAFVLACSVATASTSEPPARTIKRLRAENAALRSTVAVLFARVNQLSSDITDCVSRLPPPVGP